jgi:hypothetical protein
MITIKKTLPLFRGSIAFLKAEKKTKWESHISTQKMDKPDTTQVGTISFSAPS